jgi:hypothetical protein
MPNPLVTQHYPDDFQIHSILIQSALVTGKVVFYADRDIVVDSITFGVNVAGAASSTVQVVKTTTGTASSPISAAAASITSGATALHTAFDTSATGTLSATLATPSSDTNLVKAGNWLGLIVTGTVTNLRGVIQIRFRSRIA